MKWNKTELSSFNEQQCLRSTKNGHKGIRNIEFIFSVHMLKDFQVIRKKQRIEWTVSLLTVDHMLECPYNQDTYESVKAKKQRLIARYLIRS